MAAENRVNNRYEVNWPARIGGRGLGIAAARIKDASLSGAYLVTTLKIEPGDNVIVEIEIQIEPAAAPRPALIHSRVARKESLSAGKLFGYGVQFLKMDDEALQHLLQICS